MRSPPAWVWRLALGLECAVLLAPALAFLLMAGWVACTALLAFDLTEGEGLRMRLQLLGLFGVPFLLGSTAVFEVGRVAVATIRGRALPLGWRSVGSALAGGAGVAAWLAMGLWDPESRPAASDIVPTVIGVVAPVVALALQLLWQQRRLARGEAWRVRAADA